MRTVWALARLARPWAALALATALALGCGGGVGTGGTGDDPAVASGPITGFGSIILAGREFDDAAAVVLDDDGVAVVRDGSELRLGMTVSVEGTATGAARGEADSIRIETAVVGPVASIDAGGASFVVLGQRVRLDAATVFDASIAGGRAALRPGDPVAVYALTPDADGGRVATRVERTPAGAAARVAGTVHALDRAARTLRIGGAAFSYARAAAVPPDLADGSPVRVRVGATGAQPFEIVSFGPAEAPAPPADGTRVEVEGQVASLGAGRSFVVDRWTVDAGAARIDPNAAALVAGARVEVRGELAGGVLVAERVRVFRQADVGRRPYKLNGAVATLDAAAGTFVIRNTTVDFTQAQFVGGSAAQLAPGVRVRAEGPLAPDGTRVLASRVEFR